MGMAMVIMFMSPHDHEEDMVMVIMRRAGWVMRRVRVG